MTRRTSAAARGAGTALLAVALGGAGIAARPAAPSIGVSPSSVDFGVVLPGSVARDTLTISNDGTSPLVLGSLYVDDPTFTVGGASGGVPAGTVIDTGGNLRVPLAFRPPAAGPVSATLVVSSNDPVRPEIPVPLSGAGARPPEVTVVPDSLAVALVIGETARRTLAITNDGDTALEWRLSVQPGVGLRGLDGVRILWDRSKGQVPGVSGYSTIVGDLTAQGAIVEEIPAGQTITAERLATARVYVSEDLGVSFDWTSKERGTLAAWTRAGGAILLLGDNGSTIAKYNALLTTLGSGIRMSPTSGTGQTTVSGTRIAMHPMTAGVARLWLGVGIKTLAPVDAPAVVVVRDNADRPVVAAEPLGAGRLAVLADEMFDNVNLGEAGGVSADNRVFGRNTFEHLGGDLWVRPDSTSGTLAAGATTTIGLTIDPSDLDAGEHDLAIRLADRRTDLVGATIPVHLSLTGFPEIGVTPASVSFGGVAEGELGLGKLAVRNTGSEVLTVSDIVSSSTRFAAQPRAFVLAPAEVESVTVTFSPDSVGAFAGTLTILSDAATEPSLIVPVAGSGLVNCALPCTPPSIRPADVEGADGYAFWLDVALQSSPAPIRSFGFELLYDARHLVFLDSTRAEGLSTGFLVLAQENEPGRLTCGGFGTTPIPAGSSGSLLRLKFAVQCDTCPAGESSQIRIDEPIEDLDGVRPCCSTFTLAECPTGDGDVNRDAMLTATDALCALKIFLNGQLPPPDASCLADDDCEVPAADANCDSTVTPGDALAIYRRVLCVLDPSPLPCLALADPDPCGDGVARAAAPSLAWGMPRRVDDGTWEVPLVARDGVPRAFGLELETGGADWLDAVEEETARWTAFEARLGADGVYRIAGLRTGAEVGPAGEVGRLRLAGDVSVLRVTSAIDAAFAGPPEVKLGAHPAQGGLDVLGRSPAVAEVRLEASVAALGPSRLEIHDVTGRLVRSLARDLPPGRHRVTWDGRDAAGRAVSAGIYFVRLTAADGTWTRKLVLLR